ncbi:metal dependent phosphohydrolase containing GAF domains [Deinococcus geothermalis DSM 11300]|uniref:Metal dependent phosphohydrolase containing GAF domains n=1 Tax=Deinococcus geothermalis (strain DSM 11300 / CIP 105573 / AG-3a) TaxID=319795 RepID=Q1IWU1_DEIGD|nr:HD domain-containing phosphohydrolase [Deinococcus geothermalis]ABF46293.1 metal dependent phosphohydrolase containing GAF domains [Deinococcus geothermalis DSM 11300]
MLPHAPPTSAVHGALLDLASGTLYPLSGDWLWVAWTPGQPVALERWMMLVHAEDRHTLMSELERAVRLDDRVTRRLRFRMSVAEPAWQGGVSVEAEWRVARRAPNGQVTHLSVALRLLAAGAVCEPLPEERSSSAGLPAALADTATFTWIRGASGPTTLQISPVLTAWLGAAPTTLAELLAHLDPESAHMVRLYLQGAAQKDPLERLGELRGQVAQAGEPVIRPVLLSLPPPVWVGETQVTFGVLRDVGETFRLHEALAERERLLGEAQALARLGSWRDDRRRGGLVWSDGMFHLLGLPVGTPDLAVWLAHTHPEDWDAVQAALVGNWTEPKLTLRHRLVRPDGEERVIELRGRAEVGPDGQPALLCLQAALLDAAATVTATLDRDEVLARLIGSVGRIVPFDAASVMLLGPDGESLQVLLRKLGPNAPAEARDMPLVAALSEFPMLAANIRRGVPCLLEDVRTSRAWMDHPGRRWIRSLLLQPILLEGKLLGLLVLSAAAPGTFTPERAELVRLFMGYVGAALHNSRLYEEARREARRAGVLVELAAQLNRPLDPEQVVKVVAQGTRAALGRGCVSVVRYDARRGEWYRAARVGFEDHPGANRPEVRDRPPLPPPQVQPSQSGIGTQAALLTPRNPKDTQVLAQLGYREALLISMGQDGHFLAGLYVGLLDDVPFTPEEQALLGGIAEQAALAFVNAELRAENAARVDDLTVLNLAAQQFAQLLDETALADALADTARQSFDASSAWVAACTPEGRLVPLSPRSQPLSELGPAWPGPHPALKALASGEPVLLRPELQPDWWAAAEARGIRSAAVVPLALPHSEAEQRPLLLLLLSREPKVYTPQRLHVLSTLALHFGSALRNAWRFQDTRQRLARLEALHDLDTVISTAPDLGLVLRRVADLAAAQPGVSAVAICLYRSNVHLLEYVAVRGLDGPFPDPVSLSSEGPPAVVALEGHPLRVNDVSPSPLIGPQTWPRQTGARGYQALPLRAKGQILGVMEYTWHEEEPDAQTHVFLRVLADQAAIASESARLYRDLQRQSTSLALAYDETLEGWSRALDLRDRETEGHTQRVTDLTVRLAQAFGFAPEDLTHLRWGALLHDIGKMGIPDAILHKPGPLDPQEWAVMRRHPELALELLAPIQFLRPALDIPYSHHEKWDGSGYPRGLRGEAIPLPARLFAVVDVWDALTNDRPYRPAWTRTQALAHIRAESGKHFDPQVVEVFTALLLREYPELAEER